MQPSRLGLLATSARRAAFVEVDPLAFDDEGSVRDLRLNGSDVLTNDAEEQHLDGREEEQPDHDRFLAQEHGGAKPAAGRDGRIASAGQ
jgi:hypothetical protein